MIVWKNEAILAAWRAFNKASDNPMRAALDAAVKENGVEELDTHDFYEDGYTAAIEDVSGLIENWKHPDTKLKYDILHVVKKMKNQ